MKINIEEYINKNINEEVNSCFHSLDRLQMESNFFFGFKIQHTLNIAENLYEKGYITYPRSDAKYVTTEDFKDSKEILDKINYLFCFNNNRYYFNKKIKPHTFDTSKTFTHIGITLTTKVPDLKLLTEEQKQIYTLIASRYITQFIPSKSQRKFIFNIRNF
jgi:DNA topoisomerase-3